MQIKLNLVFVGICIAIVVVTAGIIAWDYFTTPIVEWEEYKTDITLDAGAEFSFPLHTAPIQNLVGQQIIVQAELPVNFIRREQNDVTLESSMDGKTWNQLPENNMDPILRDLLARARIKQGTSCFGLKVTQDTVNCKPAEVAMLQVSDVRDPRMAIASSFAMLLGHPLPGAIVHQNHVLITNRVLSCKAHCDGFQEWLAKQKQEQGTGNRE